MSHKNNFYTTDTKITFILLKLKTFIGNNFYGKCYK